MPASRSVDQKNLVAVLYGAAAQPAGVIAERLAAGLQERGFGVELRRFQRAVALDLRRISAAVFIAPIPLGQEEKPFLEFVRAQKDYLERMPVAFVSMNVSGSPADPAQREGTRDKGAQFVSETRTALDRLFAETGWRPTRHWPIAGSITYMRHNFVVRLILKALSKRNVPPNGRRDDWRALDAFLEEFESEIRVAEPGRETVP